MKATVATRWLGYDRSLDGHRASYFEVLQRLLLEQKLGSLEVQVGSFPWLSLLRAERVLFLTMDDYFLRYFAICLVRALIGRPTWGLSIRLHSIFQGWTPKRLLKYTLLRFLRLLPENRVLTILPFALEPRLEALATDCLLDLQFWDLGLLNVKSTPSESWLKFKKQIAEIKNGRQVVMLLGRLDSQKGVEFFAEIYQDPRIQKLFQFVVIGERRTVSQSSMDTFVNCGGLFLNEYISEGELISAYDEAQIVWSCYAPAYDQSSGVFGRALQKKKHIIVRSGSILEKWLKILKIEGLALEFGNVTDSVERLIATTQKNPSRLETILLEKPDFEKIFR